MKHKSIQFLNLLKINTWNCCSFCGLVNAQKLWRRFIKKKQQQHRQPLLNPDRQPNMLVQYFQMTGIMFAKYTICTSHSLLKQFANRCEIQIHQLRWNYLIKVWPMANCYAVIKIVRMQFSYINIQYICSIRSNKVFWFSKMQPQQHHLSMCVQCTMWPMASQFNLLQYAICMILNIECVCFAFPISRDGFWCRHRTFLIFGHPLEIIYICLKVALSQYHRLSVMMTLLV